MNKTSQKQQIAEMAERNGYKLTLGQLLQPPLAAEYRRAISELRDDGWIITCEQNYEERNKNLYTFKRPETPLEDTFGDEGNKLREGAAIRGINTTIAQDKQNLIDDCKLFMSGYPENHPQRCRIQAQIEQLEAKL